MHDNDSIELAFGRGALKLSLPSGAQPTVLRKAPLPKLDDSVAAIAAAFANARRSPPLATLVSGRQSACILICDITRPVPNRLFLRPMIETMLAAGIPRERITVLVATGLHRPNEGDELAELVGDPWVLDNVRVDNHFARDDADHVDLGVTADARHAGQARPPLRRGRPPHRHRPGRAALHGRLVGRAQGDRARRRRTHETIRTFHSARFMEDPLAVQCNLVGNPLHEEQLRDRPRCWARSTRSTP